MKTTILKLKFLVALLGLFVMVACSDDGDVDPNLDNQVKVGTVTLKSSIKDAIEVATSSKAPTLDEVLDNLNVYISQGLGISILESNYRNLPEFIELPEGNYDMIMESPQEGVYRFDAGRYGKDNINFSIFPDQNTNVDVSLSLMDVATTINFTNEVLESYPEITASVFLEGDTGFDPLVWNSSDNGRTGFIEILTRSFNPGSIFFEVTSGNLIVEIRAMDTAGNEILVSKSYPDVIANQHYRITISNSAASTVDFDITLGEEDVIEDEITFPNDNPGNGNNLAQGDLIITEIMNNPFAVDDSEGEWFEIFNTTTDKDILLDGIKIVGNSSEFIVNSDLIISPGSYLVFGINNDATTNGGIPVDYKYDNFTLGNSSGSISIEYNDSEIDRVIYDSFAMEAGRAMKLDQNTYNSLDNDDSSNWCLATDELPSGDFGTPKESNGVCN